MPKTIEPAPIVYEPAPNRKRWTRKDCDLLRESGLLDGAYELINGEIISKMGQKPAHRTAVILLRNWLIAVFGGARVQSQAPVLISDHDNDSTEPEPDVAVTLCAATEYTESNPTADQVVFVGEISDSTLQFDRGEKAAIYEQGGIREYWIVDISGRQLIVYRAPAHDRYTEIASYAEDEYVSLIDNPDVGVRVSELLPPV